MKYISLLLVFSLFLIGCESHTYDDISGFSTTPNYNKHIKPIMENNCVSCHNPTYGQFPNLTNYDEVKDATLNGNVACRVDASCGAIMPQAGKMASPSILMIQYWKNTNCPEN